jgi:hypothetical protein
MSEYHPKQNQLKIASVMLLRNKTCLEGVVFVLSPFVLLTTPVRFLPCCLSGHGIEILIFSFRPYHLIKRVEDYVKTPKDRPSQGLN